MSPPRHGEDKSVRTRTRRGSTKVSPDEGSVFVEKGACCCDWCIPTVFSPCTCVWECCLPTLMISTINVCCCCAGWKQMHLEKNICAPPRLRAGQSAQSWMLRHPFGFGVMNSACCCLIEPCFAIPDAAATSTALYLASRNEFGGAFVDNMKLELGVPLLLERILGDEPTDRGNHLGQVRLEHAKLPKDRHGRDTFPLVLSSDDDETLQHSRLRAMLFKYVINEDATKRQQARDDVTTARLLEKLRDDLREHSTEVREKTAPAETFLEKLKDDLKQPSGVAREKKMLRVESKRLDEALSAIIAEFVLRYEHYVLLGMVLDDAEFALLKDYYFYPKPDLGKSSITTWYMKWIGSSVTGAHGRKLPALQQQVIDLYVKKAPALAAFRYTDADGLTRQEFSKFFTMVMGIAALQGPRIALETVLKGAPDHVPIPADFELPSDREGMRLFLLETLRLKPAVFGATSLLRYPMKVKVSGTDRVFPKGCPVHQNFTVHGRDKATWGRDADSFKPKERQSKLWGPDSQLCVFNSVGDKSFGGKVCGRMCPGRDFSIEMIVDVMIVVYGPGGITPHWVPEKRPSRVSTPVTFVAPAAHQKAF